MLDKVVVLEDTRSAVAVELEADAPLWQVRLKLWDDEGRSPDAYEVKHEKPDKATWPLPAGLHGRTLTWSVRMASKGRKDAAFSVRIRVVENGETLPGSEFVYSGPLDEFEERTGQFHFKVS